MGLAKSTFGAKCAITENVLQLGGTISEVGGFIEVTEEGFGDGGGTSAAKLMIMGMRGEMVAHEPEDGGCSGSGKNVHSAGFGGTFIIGNVFRRDKIIPNLALAEGLDVIKRNAKKNSVEPVVWARINV